MYKIKQLPEDFIVEEISKTKITNKGIYSYFLLTKCNYTTMDAIDKIAKKLKVPLKWFGFAGTKDKRAITTQLVSVKGIKKERLERVKLRDISVKFLGYGDEPVSLGDLDGNKFIIVVRNLDKGLRVKKNKKIINYFGEQRFSKRNHLIGKAIVKRYVQKRINGAINYGFKNATNLILKSNGDIEKKVKNYLNENPSDYVGALRIIPKKILKMYVHSYQSYIWNKTVEYYLRLTRKRKNIKIPIVGFGSEFVDKEIKNIIFDILEKQGVGLRDFIIKEIPELSSEGSNRDLFVEIENLKICKPKVDELNKGKKKVKLSFKLQKGSYATVVVREVFEE